MNKSIQVVIPSMPRIEEYIEEIKDLWDSHWLTNMGEKHKKLEAKLINYLKVPDIVLFANGHLALEATLNVFELTGEIITTPFTFVSTAHAIVRNNLKPVFCDINPEDYTIDANKLESLITKKTSAIIPIHIYGNICDVNKIDKIAKKYNLKIIYDAAHAFGVQINGIGVGNFGDASMFSFHSTKIFHTIEGGAVCLKDEKLKMILNYLKNFGITGTESVEYVGGNAKMNEFQAAMGICNLRNIDEEIEKRKIIVDRYSANLSDIKGIKLLKAQTGIKQNYAYFPVIFDGFKKTRDEVFEELMKNNIFTRKYFYPLVSDFDCYKYQYNSSDTPIAKYIADRVLTLPLYADLSLDDVDKICKIIIK